MKQRAKGQRVILMWRQPRAVTDWVIQNELIPEYKEILLSFWKLQKWLFLFGVPTLCILWKWFPEAIFPASFAGSMVLIVVPVTFASLSWTVAKFDGVSCVINEQGLWKTIGFYKYPWKNIESYWFTDHPHSPGTRCLWIKAKRDRIIVEISFCFSHFEVEEAKIAQILGEHLRMETR